MLVSAPRSDIDRNAASLSRLCPVVISQIGRILEQFSAAYTKQGMSPGAIEENHILRAQLKGHRIEFTNTERRQLAVSAHSMDRKHLPASAAVFPLITVYEPAETEALALESTGASAFLLEQ